MLCLEVRNKALEEINDELNNHIHVLSFENKTLSSDLQSACFQNKKTQVEIQNYKQDLLDSKRKYIIATKKIAGMRSGIKRKVSSTVIVPAKKLCSTNLDKTSVETQTDIFQIDTDLVQMSKNNENENVLSGVLYYKKSDKYKQNTSGKCSTYIKIPQMNNISKVTKRQVRNNAKSALSVISNIAGSEAKQDKQTLVVQMIRQDKTLFTDALGSIGLHVRQKMSVNHAVQMASLLRLSTKKMREVRTFLNQTGIGNFLPSENKVREAQSDLTEYLKQENFEMGKVPLETKANDEKLKERAYIKIESLENFLENLVTKVNTFRQDPEFNNELWFLFSGDKGGAQMKFHVEIVNDTNSGSRDAVHPYCMFEALDSVNNMWKVYSSYREFLTDLQKPGFELSGYKVKIFLGGDYHFLSDNLGHQGQSATYPSPLDLVTRDHLQNHYGSPHSPDTCEFEVRTVSDYQENYYENLSANKGLRDDGKHHNSVVNAMLFPIANLDNVVPALLHIHLGIVLALFVMLEK